MIAGSWLWPVSEWYISERTTWTNKAPHPVVSEKERKKKRRVPEVLWVQL